jgi:cyclic pyranopterin phosphate synthase
MNTLIDKFGRQISYLRISVTDRCDFRCVYCMAEDMTFLPRSEVLTLEEIYFIASTFVSRGVNKLRLTGGEPLVRKNILSLVERLGPLEGLDDFALTTNGSHLQKYAHDLKKAGLDRINVSLDTLEADKFTELTRTGDLNVVLDGIEEALVAGFKRIKINSVILKGRNDQDILPLIDFIQTRGIDISFIEEMPLGNITEHDRGEAFMSSDEIREMVHSQFPLEPCAAATGGPSRYYQFKNNGSQIKSSGSRVGFISPHSHNFCGDCNRVRLTAEGRLLLCLGNEHSRDLKKIVRDNPGSSEILNAALDEAMTIKPERHYFDLNEKPGIVRFMNMTGG